MTLHATRTFGRRTHARRFRAAALALASVLTLPALAEDAKPEAAPATTGAITEPAAAQSAPAQSAAPQPAAAASPIAGALAAKLSDAKTEGDEPAAREAAAIAEFYAARQNAPVWFSDTGASTGASPKTQGLIDAIQDADAYGLEARDFALPPTDGGPDADAKAASELKLTKAALLYARYARGGRIMKPSEQLNSNIDRKPQLLEPKAVLDGLAAAGEPGAYLASLHPKHPQFEKLRQAYLAARNAKDGHIADPAKPLNASARRLRANMEMWRWMYDDMGELYVFNNIPEFMQYVYKDGKIIRAEKIVAGMVDKPSSIFSRPLKHVVLRPKWRVPESIKVNELWPSLIRGGGLMREYGLQLETKDGKALDWRQIDWTKADIRNYEVTQPPGGKSVLGSVKFSFPSQHTIYMHDTPDKWMFRQSQRTLSHGCLRVWKPVELAEIILDYDKGWDKAKVGELIRSGPLNNEVEIEKRVMINLVYFTAWVGDDGRVRAFSDVYGHERRVSQALEGQWDKIAKGRDHLAPVEPSFNPKAVAASSPAAQGRRKQAQSTGDIISDVFGGLNF